MADKNFIGKVFEKTFNNGGSVIKLTLSPEEKEKIYRQLPGDTTIEIKKSQKGNWYAEISSYQPAPQQQAPRPYPQNNAVSFVDEPSDLPF